MKLPTTEILSNLKGGGLDNVEYGIIKLYYPALV